MNLASHELNDLSELIMSCFNTVTCMGNFIQHAQDPELKAMLTRHYPKHIVDYNLKVEFVKSASVPDITKFQPDPLKVPTAQVVQASGTVMPAAAPRTNASALNDREIATAYLLNQKAAAKNYASAVLECAHPELRTFLENAFLNSSRHSYEIWQYMKSRGYYPLAPAPQEAIGMIGNMYQLVQQMPPPSMGAPGQQPFVQ